MKLIAQINILFFQKTEVTFLKYINTRNNQLLSKSTLKYPVYCQDFGLNYGIYKTNEYL